MSVAERGDYVITNHVNVLLVCETIHRDDFDSFGVRNEKMRTMLDVNYWQDSND